VTAVMKFELIPDCLQMQARNGQRALPGSGLRKDKAGTQPCGQRTHKPKWQHELKHFFRRHQFARVTRITRVDGPRRAARVQGKSRTDFMLEASREKAEQVLLDQTFFTVDAKQYQAFLALMDAPLADKVALQRLLGKPSPWEK
jgi:uncharacterized protein (DUF1778 family)